MLAALVLCGGLEARLDERISFDLVETPFAEAVEFIKERSGLPVVLDKDELKGALSCPVTLLAEDISVREALRWVTRLAGADFAAVDGEVRISTVKALISETATLKIHDVRDLTKPLPYFAGPKTLPMDVPNEARGGTPPPMPRWTLPRAIEAGSLVEFVETQLRPETWAEGMGTYIEERSGQLIVNHTPEMHAAIRRLLAEFRREALRTIAVTVEELILPEEEAKRLWPSILTQTEAGRLRKEALEARSVNVVCMKGQKVRSIGCAFKRFLADFDVKDGAYVPVMGSLNIGLSLTAKPELTWDARAVQMELDIASYGEPEIITFRPFSGPATGEASNEALVPGALELPRMKVIILSPRFELPLGMSALFWAGEQNRAFLVSAEPVQP